MNILGFYKKSIFKNFSCIFFLLFYLLISLVGSINEFASGNELAHKIHQWDQFRLKGEPCFYGLNLDERQVFIERCEKSSYHTNAMNIPVVAFKEAYQEVLFTMARDRFNENNHCLEKLLIILRERKTEQERRIHNQWVDEIASSYALYLVHNAEAHKNFYQAKREYNLQIQALEKSSDPEKKKKRNDLSSNYQFEVEKFNTTKRFASSFVENLPFLSHEQSEDFILDLSKKLFPQLGEKYRFQPDAMDIPKGELEEKIAKILNEISDNYFEQIRKTISSEVYMSKKREITDREKGLLWDRGFVLDVLGELLEDLPKLKEKLKNCVEGNYGTYSKVLNSIYDLGEGIVLARQFYKIDKAKIKEVKDSYYEFHRLFRLPPTRTGHHLVSSPIAVSPFRFALNTSGIIFFKKQFEMAYDICVKKTPRYAAIQVPKSCDKEEELETFSLDSLGLASCMREVRRTLLF